MTEAGHVERDSAERRFNADLVAREIAHKDVSGEVAASVQPMRLSTGYGRQGDRLTSIASSQLIPV
ncbi:hypothetical protein GCM10010331_44020 [Streptomyces xanthochromogenes]|nr:hypothetical protein GCM10010331_44020 [Streptomyces xanthochromogenes]